MWRVSALALSCCSFRQKGASGDGMGIPLDLIQDLPSRHRRQGWPKTHRKLTAGVRMSDAGLNFSACCQCANCPWDFSAMFDIYWTWCSPDDMSRSIWTQLLCYSSYEFTHSSHILCWQGYNVNPVATGNDLLLSRTKAKIKSVECFAWDLIPECVNIFESPSRIISPKYW